MLGRRDVPMALVAVVATLLVGVASAQADDTLTTVTRPALLSAEGGRLAWSSFDPASGRYSLMTSFAGVTSAVPVRQRAVPFDVSLGVRNPGATVAAYSRCRREPPRRDPAIGNAIVQMPDWARGRGCDLYLYDFDTGKERRLAGPSSRRGSEFLPSVWRDRVAFARTYPQRAGAGGLHPHLYLRSLRGSHGARRLPGGSRSRLRFCSGTKPRHCRLKVEPGPTALDLEGRQLAFAWDSGYTDGPTSAAYLDTIGGRRSFRRRLDSVSSGDIQGAEVLTPTIDDGQVFWELTLYGDTRSNTLKRFQISTGKTQLFSLPGPESQESYLRPVLATTVAAGATYYLASGVQTNEPGCSVQTPCSDPPGCSDTAPCQIRLARNIVAAAGLSLKARR